MQQFKIEPFLWIHLGGLAAAPLWLMLMWLGFAIGTPFPFYWVELLFVAIIGIIPIFWMQWTRPFDIFSILLVALKPAQLTDEQRKILSLFKTRKNKILTLITAVGLLSIGWYLYQWAPLGTVTVIHLPQWRILGLIIAAIAFLLSNLFVQIPVSVLGVLLTSPQTWSKTNPYETDKITQDFTVLGLRVNKIFFIPTLPDSTSLTEKTS